MSKNKLYNKSYFSKRLIEQGFYVIKLNIPFQKDDLRKWVVVVNPNKKDYNYNFNVFVTCYKDEENKDFSFKFQGQNFEDFVLNTKSMKLIIMIFKKTIELFKNDKSIDKQIVDQLKQEQQEHER